MEQLCYALTDLAYRIDYPLPDLLATDDGTLGDSLYPPAQLLPSQPLTRIDLRKLVLDVEGVKNAWIESHTAPGSPLGLYRVSIEPDDPKTPQDAQRVKQRVAHALHAHRNLCEDIEEIEVLETQDIRVNAHIEIGPAEDAEVLLAAIYDRIDAYMSPTVQFETLSQRLEAGDAIDDIFDGPPLQHGFIDTAALRRNQRRTALYTSDIIREIMDVAGVRAVRSLSLGMADGNDVQEEKWSLKLDSDKIPLLALDASSVVLAYNRVRVSLNAQNVRAAYEKRRQDGRPVPALDDSPLPPPTGRRRDVGRYRSVQHQFPAAYGIGELGLPPSASPQRQSQARQLKAYLMFFDQLLANMFAQLAHVKDLFTFSGDTPRTYFSNMIDDPKLALNGIRLHDSETHRSHLPHITAETASGSDPARQETHRRHRFLNHLLARFAETFTDYALTLDSQQTADDGSADDQLVLDKQAFLQHYPQISRNRGTAFNYLLPWLELQPSGLEKRIRFKLGLTDAAAVPIYIIEHILMRPTGEVEDPPREPVFADADRDDPYSLQLTVALPTWPSQFDQESFTQLVEQTVREETPAHLSLVIHWLDKDQMETFKTAYQTWLEKRRRIEHTKLDTPPPDPTAVAVEAAAIVDDHQSAVITIAQPQPGATYWVYTRPIAAQAFVRSAATDADILTVPVPGKPAVRLRPPNVSETWAPADAIEVEAYGPEVLPVMVGPFTEDCWVVVQNQATAEFEHVAAILVRPNPAPPLSLTVLQAEGTSAGTHQVVGGQPGVFYHFRREPGGDVGLPVYIHERDADDPTVYKGVSQLAVGVNLAVAPNDFPPETPIFTAGDVPSGTPLYVRAVKAQTGVEIELEQPVIVP